MRQYGATPPGAARHPPHAFGVAEGERVIES